MSNTEQNVIDRIAAMAKATMETHVAELGESPEAWRGAAVVAHQMAIVCSIQTEMFEKLQQSKEEGSGELWALNFLAVMAGIIEAVMDNPMAPCVCGQCDQR